MIMKFADVEVGKEYPARPFTATEESVRAYLAAVGDANPLYLDNRLVPPAYAALMARWESLADEQLAPGTIHAKQSFSYHKPMHWNQTLTLTGRVKERKEKRGLKFVIREVTVHDADGDLCVTSTISTIFPA